MDVATNGAWTYVADHVQRRMNELGISQAELARRSKIATALGWSPDSIDLILAGEEPIPITPLQPIDEVREALKHLADQVADSRRVLEDRSRRIDERLDDLAADVRRLAARALDQDPG
jgi:transcriptional regulator with XRE-family HTH domain